MEKLHKEPDVRRQDYNAFLNELQLFHQNKGTSFRQLPRINGREVDLFKLYNQVTALGGLQKVNDLQKWDSVIDLLRIPRACVNSALALRQIYIRYLANYEKIHFMGEDLESERGQSSESHTRKQNLTLLHPVPMSYNHLQHELTEIQRSTSGLNQIFTNRTDYDKLCMSLLSALPNEQELALNVCTILSNEGNYMLHLEQTPKLVNLLLCQAGLWPSGDDSLRQVYTQGWDNIKGRNMRRFWRSTLVVKYPKLLELCDWHIGPYDEDENLLNLEYDLGTLNVEGQRVLRVALILHNLSFEKNNVPVLVSNVDFLRFLLLGMHSSWSDLKQTTYDTLANLAIEIKLSIEKSAVLKLIFQTIMDEIQSSDRFLVIKSLDILAQLCNCEQNEDIIPSRIDVEIYEQIVSFLTVHDIMLLVFTLEALYALSDLGRYACDKIVSVHRAVGALVSLLTVDPNQYGAAAQIRVKVVETLVPAEVDPDPKESQSGQTTSVNSTTTTSSDEPESFVCTWLKQTYEYADGSTVARNELYADYVSHCSKIGRKGVVNANVFASCVKGIFTQSGLKKLESGNGVISFHHDGLQRKKVPNHPVDKIISCTTPIKKVPPNSSPSHSSPSPKPGQKTTHSPILKAQLSAPPRPGITSPQAKRPIQTPISNASPSASPVSIFTPANNTPTVSANTGSSTLIKSLLANKVQQRNLQRQLQPNVNVRKMVIYTPEKPGINRTINATQTTVVRAIRPGSVPQSCIATAFTRAPIQSNTVTNKARIVSATPPRGMKPNTIVIPKVQTIKQAITTNSVRPNGMVHDFSSEVFVQPEEIQSLIDGNALHGPPVKSVENHLSLDKSLVDSNDSILSDVESMKESCFSSDSERNSLLSLDDASNFASTLADTSSSMQSNSLSEHSTEKDSKCSDISFVHSTSEASSVDNSAANSQQNSTLPSMLLKSVLEEFNVCNSELNRQVDKDKICKRAPLLNGLLDKGKLPLSKELNSVSLIQNGSKSKSLFEINSEDKTSCSENTLSSTLLTSPFASNGDSLMQICTGQTTLSGTIEVQPDQKGVVRLHIESPENSNQGSDLSSISDITRTLECASKAISRTNAECSSQIPFTCACETTATVTVITTNTPTLARSGQQFIVVTPALNQPQLHIQSPNIKFRIVQGIPKMEETGDLIGFPRVSLNQLSQIRQTTAVETSPISTATVKRPSNDSQKLPACPDAKKPRVDTKTPLLEATLRLPTPVPSTVTANGVNIKPFQDNQSLLAKSTTPMESLSPSKLSTAKAVAVPLQNVDFPNEREVKTFSGLSSAGNDAPAVVTTNAPTRPTSPPPPSSSKIEYFCEWKDCNKKFSSPGSVLIHAGKEHAPYYCTDDMLCLWEGCDSMKRRRFSLLTHLQDWHCSERILNIQALRRRQLSQQGKTAIAAPQMPPPHPGYAPDAAILAIRRHALQYLNPKELSEEKESALTKSIRLTSALILRNLVTHSSLARSHLRCYEPELAYLAMSPVESSRTIAQCLSELSRSHD